jgi:hypothetical protein
MKVKIEKRRIIAWAVVVTGGESNGEPSGSLHPITYPLDARQQGHEGGHYVDFFRHEESEQSNFDLWNLRTLIPATAVMQVLLVATDDKGKDIYVSDGKTPAGTVRAESIIGLDTAGYDNEAEWERRRKDAEGNPEEYFFELGEEHNKRIERNKRLRAAEEKAWQEEE